MNDANYLGETTLDEMLQLWIDAKWNTIYLLGASSGLLLISLGFFYLNWLNMAKVLIKWRGNN